VNESTMIATATIVESQLEESTALTPNERPSKHRIPVFNKAFSFNLRSFLPGGDDFSLRRFTIIEAAMLLIMGYLASKGLGVVRQTIFNALFGTGMQANAYYAASRLPDTLFDLIAGGALTHAFIPIFLSYEKDRGQREAWRLASLVFNVLLVALTALVIVSEFVAPAFVSRLLVPGYPPAQQALTAALTRVMLIQPLILGLGTVVTAILNSKRQFFLPALSLAIYNVGLIGGLLFSLAIPRIGIYGPTYGVLAAAALQVLVMVPALVKQGVRYTFIWDLRNPGLRQVMRLLIPNALAVAIASTGFIVDTAFISYLPDQVSLAAERNAHMLYALPLALLGLAIGQAALPQLSSLAATGRYVRLRMTVVKLIGGALSLSLIASLMMYLLGKPAIRLLFQHGAFGKHSSAVTGTALLGYAFALPAVIAASLLVLSFYALKDARTPLLINILGLATRWSLIILLLRLFTGSHMILAIPLAAGGVGIVETLVLGSLLFIRLRSKVKTDKGMLRLERRRGQHAKTSAEQQEQEDGLSEQSIKEPGESRIGLKGPEESEETFT